MLRLHQRRLTFARASSALCLVGALLLSGWSAVGQVAAGPYLPAETAAGSEAGVPVTAPGGLPAAQVATATATATNTPIVPPTLTLGIAATPAGPVNAGAQVVFTLTVTNTGTVNAVNVQIIDVFNYSGTGYVFTTPPVANNATFVSTGTGGTLTVPFLQPGQTAYVTFTGTVTGSGTIGKSASVTSGCLGAGCVATLTPPLTVGSGTSASGLSITKIAQPPGPVPNGTRVNYVVTVTNNSTTAQSITVTDIFTFTGGANYTGTGNPVASTGTYTSNPQTLIYPQTGASGTWTITALAVGGQATLTFSGNVSVGPAPWGQTQPPTYNPWGTTPYSPYNPYATPTPYGGGYTGYGLAPSVTNSASIVGTSPLQSAIVTTPIFAPAPAPIPGPAPAPFPPMIGGGGGGVCCPAPAPVPLVPQSPPSVQPLVSTPTAMPVVVTPTRQPTTVPPPPTPTSPPAPPPPTAVPPPPTAVPPPPTPVPPPPTPVPPPPTPVPTETPEAEASPTPQIVVVVVTATPAPAPPPPPAPTVAPPPPPPPVTQRPTPPPPLPVKQLPATGETPFPFAPEWLALAALGLLAIAAGRRLRG